MKAPSTSAKRHLNNYHRSKKQSNNFLLFLLLLLVSQKKVFASSPSLFAPNTSEQSLAYVNKGNNREPKPLMRAWMCHGKTQKEMCDKLASAGIVKAAINKQALRSVDRRNYVLNEDYAYEDAPQLIGYGQTISAPHMHAHVLEDLLPPLLRASKNQPMKPLSILDVGCGSGYLTAVFGRMVEPKGTRKTLFPSSSLSVLNDGKVYGIDVVPELVEMSKTNILKEDGDLFDSNTIELAVRDGWKGYPEGSPYNAIHVGAAAATFPQDLMKQLAPGGVMVIPVGPDGGTQYLYQVERVGDSGEVVGVKSHDSRGFQQEDYQIQRVLGVRYVPLVRTD
mmetsp:Transcript_1535/g.3270  ORF Transcript_1535/g.3270 Transcript_1535/m.3270 type:complete len:336 (-) Transcript_1535:131-1138(-)|eukprot:CAMPEP_0172312966 /NCGR_PEP_ID=MMETSP1058-20130122/18918_1 /TAXON_ID=83371 /ORGANISM="Detonula confervacea, Strain CCMP 353" /LENGTH=335 /DNA_ID=CAMNT_0013026535 /DNA_START=92 /DNA_END=1099 /DNA_ORIENTATION=+